MGDLDKLYKFLRKEGHFFESKLLKRMTKSSSNFFLNNIKENVIDFNIDENYNPIKINRDFFKEYLNSVENSKINNLFEKAYDEKFFKERFVYVHFIGLYRDNLSKEKNMSEIVSNMVRDFKSNNQKLDLSTMAIDSKNFNISDTFYKYNKRFNKGNKGLMLIVEGTPTLANTVDSYTVSDESGKKTFLKFNDKIFKTLFWDEESFEEAFEHKEFYSEVVLKDWNVSGIYMDLTDSKESTSNLFLTSLNLNIPIYAQYDGETEAIISSKEESIAVSQEGEIREINLNDFLPLKTLNAFMQLKEKSEDEIDFCAKVADNYFGLENTSQISKFIKNIIMNEIEELSKKDYYYVYNVLKKHKDDLEFIDSIYPLKNIVLNFIPISSQSEEPFFEPKSIFKLLNNSIYDFSLDFRTLIKEKAKKLDAIQLFSSTSIPNDIFDSLIEEKAKELDAYNLIGYKNIIPENIFNSLLEEKAKNLDADGLFSYKDSIPEYIFESLVEEKAKNLDPENLFFYKDSIPKNIFESLIEEKAKNLDPENLFFYKDSIPKHIFESLVEEKAMKLDSGNFFYHKDLFPENIFKYLAEEKAKELSSSNFFRLKDSIPKNIYNSLAEEKAKGLNSNELFYFKDSIPKDIYDYLSENETSHLDVEIIERNSRYEIISNLFIKCSKRYFSV